MLFRSTCHLRLLSSDNGSSDKDGVALEASPLVLSGPLQQVYQPLGQGTPHPPHNWEMLYLPTAFLHEASLSHRTPYPTASLTFLRSINLPTWMPPLCCSAQRFVWAAKQPLGNAALGALFTRVIGGKLLTSECLGFLICKWGM